MTQIIKTNRKPNYLEVIEYFIKYLNSSSTVFTRKIDIIHEKTKLSLPEYFNFAKFHKLQHQKSRPSKIKRLILIILCDEI